MFCLIRYACNIEGLDVNAEYLIYTVFLWVERRASNVLF